MPIIEEQEVLTKNEIQFINSFKSLLKTRGIDIEKISNVKANAFSMTFDVDKSKIRIMLLKDSS